MGFCLRLRIQHHHLRSFKVVAFEFAKPFKLAPSGLLTSPVAVGILAIGPSRFELDRLRLVILGLIINIKTDVVGLACSVFDQWHLYFKTLSRQFVLRNRSNTC